MTVIAAIGTSGEQEPGAIYVSFYASTDTEITKSDYYLGQVSIVMSANSWTKVTLHCTLPTNIPAGTYYVGWIIDPENAHNETNESNNTAFNELFMLIVAGESKPVIYVDISARGAEDGSSWANAFHSLQDALGAAVEGSEIRVAGGVYRPDRGVRVKRGDRWASFELRTGVAILGGHAGAGGPNPDARDIAAWRTILSGDLNGDDLPIADPCELWIEASRFDNSRHVVTAIDADRTTILDGVQIVGGWASGLFDATAEPGDSQGAGLYLSGGGPRVRRCTISENWAAEEGGAVYATDSNAELFECTLTRNAAGNPHDSLATGGAICVASGSLALVSCTLHGNLSSGSGGGVEIGPGGTLSAVNCCLHANRAMVRAGAIHALDSHAVLLNCTIAGNLQVSDSGALVWESSGGFDESGLQITNCILWNQGQELAVVGDPAIAVSYSDVPSAWWLGLGNIDADPRFLDPHGPDEIAGTEDDDLRLAADSPCIDRGDVAALPEDVTDLDDDGDVTELLPLDRDGRERVIGDAVDMGAYEASQE